MVEITGCKKPCSYKEYKLGEERVEPEDLPAGQMKFGLWSSTELTNIETEVLLYPFTSLLAVRKGGREAQWRDLGVERQTVLQ